MKMWHAFIYSLQAVVLSIANIIWRRLLSDKKNIVYSPYILVNGDYV